MMNMFWMLIGLAMAVLGVALICKSKHTNRNAAGAVFALIGTGLVFLIISDSPQSSAKAAATPTNREQTERQALQDYLRFGVTQERAWWLNIPSGERMDWPVAALFYPYRDVFNEQLDPDLRYKEGDIWLDYYRRAVFPALYSEYTVRWSPRLESVQGVSKDKGDASGGS